MAKRILRNLLGFPVPEHVIMAGQLSNDALVQGIKNLGGNGQWKFLKMSLVFWLGNSHPHNLNFDFHFL